MNKSKISTAEIVEALRICGNGSIDCNDCAFHPGYQHHGPVMCGQALLFVAAYRLERLEKELQAARKEAEDISEDFVDYVAFGFGIPATYCKNKSAECTTERGWCVEDKCKGFSPKAWSGRAQE